MNPLSTPERIALAASNNINLEDTAAIMGMSYNHICRVAKECGVEFIAEPPRVKMSPYVSKDTLTHIKQTGRMPG